MKGESIRSGEKAVSFQTRTEDKPQLQRQPVPFCLCREKGFAGAVQRDKRKPLRKYRRFRSQYPGRRPLSGREKRSVLSPDF